MTIELSASTIADRGGNFFDAVSLFTVKEN